MSTNFANSLNADLIDQNYSLWSRDPQSVDSYWAAFFEGFELGSSTDAATPPGAGESLDAVPLQTRVEGLVYGYRTLGHTIAMVNPLNTKRPEQPLLELEEFGFDERDLDLTVASKFFKGGRPMKLREMIASLEKIYAGSVAAEFMHIQNIRVRNWVRERLEVRTTAEGLDPERKNHILRLLLEAETFEHFLHTKYVGQKRFSLEGGESLMVILDTLLQSCPERGVEEIVMGMAHRGRLNVLANFMKKSLKVIFTEFSENFVPDLVAGDGDVKYHLGYRTTRETVAGNKIEVLLSANPSHLEAVNPVVQGMARARQRILKDTEQRSKVLPLLLHGDAAFAGQGIVAETLNLSQLPGYKTGGTVHVIVNNQIGFTTLPADARSTIYATDVAKMIEAPIFHVNGDDPLACVYVSELAFEIRQRFKRDVVIDLYCYRRHGHNEGDEPLFTQPSMYREIERHPSVRRIFTRKLIDSGVMQKEEAEKLEEEFEESLQATLDELKKAEAESEGGRKQKFAESTAVFQPEFTHDKGDTNLSWDRMEEIVKALTTVPSDFAVLPKIKRMLLDRRAQIFKNGGPFDWSYAETLAFASLLIEGVPVRLSGQDSRRGTFSQRHSVLYDRETRERYSPLMNLSPDQARFCVYNSLLSEAAVLGFDYGYSLEFPDLLCLWEAQFGDFANGAQVIIDQFIAPAESKWQQVSGIVMLLPHGYEGQGPEHSSARLERFLQLCAEDNMQVCYPTTPGQYFHLLRRQVKRSFRKPLVVMTPKSLLRSDLAVSSIEDFTNAEFEEILPGPLPADPSEIKRIILCSGKVYYDLLRYRESNNISDATLIRVEQLYPLKLDELQAEVSKYPKAEKFVWCQEESQNMGAWNYLGATLRMLFNNSIWYAGRNASSSAAVGAKAIHEREQRALIEDAFTL